MHLESRRLLHHIDFGYHLMGEATQITVSAKRSCNGKTVCSAILPYHLLRHFLSPGLNLPRYTIFSKMWPLSASRPGTSVFRIPISQTLLFNTYSCEINFKVFIDPSFYFVRKRIFFINIMFKIVNYYLLFYWINNPILSNPCCPIFE